MVEIDREKLQLARESQGLSWLALGREVGQDWRQIRRWEEGTATTIDLEKFAKVAERLGFEGRHMMELLRFDKPKKGRRVQHKSGILNAPTLQSARAVRALESIAASLEKMVNPLAQTEVRQTTSTLPLDVIGLESLAGEQP